MNLQHCWQKTLFFKELKVCKRFTKGKMILKKLITRSFIALNSNNSQEQGWSSGESTYVYLQPMWPGFKSWHQDAIECWACDNFGSTSKLLFIYHFLFTYMYDMYMTVPSPQRYPSGYMVAAFSFPEHGYSSRAE